MNGFIAVVLFVMCGVIGCRSVPETSVISLRYSDPALASKNDDLPPIDTSVPWNIVLKGVYIEKINAWFNDGQIAVLIKVDSGEKSEIDNKWVLAAYEKDVSAPGYLNLQDIVVWSGISANDVEIEIRLLDVESLDINRRKELFSVVQNKISFIPAYGIIAKELIQAANSLIAEVPETYTLLRYARGFYPKRNLRYQPYILMGKKESIEFGENLWFDEAGANCVKQKGNKEFKKTHVAFEITKGKLHTFEVARDKSIDKLLEDAKENRAASELHTNLSNDIGEVVVTSTLARILHDLQFDEASVIIEAIKNVSDLLKDKGLHVTSRDLNDIQNILRSILPNDSDFGDIEITTPESCDNLIKRLKTIRDKYEYDSRSYKWLLPLKSGQARMIITITANFTSDTSAGLEYDSDLNIKLTTNRDAQEKETEVTEDKVPNLRKSYQKKIGDGKTTLQWRFEEVLEEDINKVKIKSKPTYRYPYNDKNDVKDPPKGDRDYRFEWEKGSNNRFHPISGDDAKEPVANLMLNYDIRFAYRN